MANSTCVNNQFSVGTLLEICCSQIDNKFSRTRLANAHKFHEQGMLRPLQPFPNRNNEITFTHLQPSGFDNRRCQSFQVLIIEQGY